MNEVSTGAAYAVLYSVLLVLSVLTLGSAGWFPESILIRGLCTLKNQYQSSSNDVSKVEDGGTTTTTRSNFFTTDYFLSARNAAGFWAVALSYFAAGMGAWVREAQLV
jgi:solute:Na+ symporter, SSS family